MHVGRTVKVGPQALVLVVVVAARQAGPREVAGLVHLFRHGNAGERVPTAKTAAAAATGHVQQPTARRAPPG